MKKLLQFFGLLDIITLIRSYQHIIPRATTWSYYPGIAIGNSLLDALLILSAYFLVRQNKIGLWLTYIQFPLRLAFLILSFGFLLLLNRFFNNKTESYIIIIWVLVVLEILRLIFTIHIHRKYFSTPKVALT